MADATFSVYELVRLTIGSSYLVVELFFSPQIRLFSCKLHTRARPTGAASLASPDRAANSPDILGRPLMTYDSPGFYRNGLPDIVLDLTNGY